MKIKLDYRKRKRTINKLFEAGVGDPNTYDVLLVQQALSQAQLLWDSLLVVYGLTTIYEDYDTYHI